ncbi:MAG: 3-methyl-2-oxobutanoate hydroxymethyltransferase [Polyangiales bacterium]
MSNPKGSKGASPATRLTASHLVARAAAGEKLVMVTAYDATFARIAEAAEVDAILVGDSLGMVIQGHDTTLPVTVDEVLYHTKAVVRGSTRAHVVADMPFMSYQASEDDAVRNAGRMLAEGGAQSVKLEGGRTVAPLVDRLVRTGIPVMGHVGLTPQSVNTLGGFRVQGRGVEAARSVFEDANALAEAGAFAVVLEGVPRELAARISRTLPVPTIGIGAGPECGGQVLVGYDLLGLTKGDPPKFVKRFADLRNTAVEATRAFAEEVRTGAFPTDRHAYHDPQDPGAAVEQARYGTA